MAVIVTKAQLKPVLNKIFYSFDFVQAAKATQLTS
jgi:hypothetical protein